MDEEESIVSGKNDTVVWDRSEVLDGGLGEVMISVLLITSGIELTLSSVEGRVEYIGFAEFDEEGYDVVLVSR